MTHDELKALLREWYEAGKSVNLGSMAGVDEFMDVQFRLKTYTRTPRAVDGIALFYPHRQAETASG